MNVGLGGNTRLVECNHALVGTPLLTKLLMLIVARVEHTGAAGHLGRDAGCGSTGNVPRQRSAFLC